MRDFTHHSVIKTRVYCLSVHFFLQSSTLMVLIQQMCIFVATAKRVKPRVAGRGQYLLITSLVSIVTQVTVQVVGHWTVTVGAFLLCTCLIVCILPVLKILHYKAYSVIRFTPLHFKNTSFLTLKYTIT